MDDIEAKLDSLIEMYKADRQTGTAASDDAAVPSLTASSTSSKLLHGPPPSLPQGPDDDVSATANSPTVVELVRRARPSRPMLRNLSDLGPRVTCRGTALWPPVSVLVTSSVSPTDEHASSVNAERSPTASSPLTICESNDEVDGQHSPQPHDDDDDDNDNADAVKLLPLPVAEGDDARANHVAPQQFVDHVSSSSSMIGRTVSPSDNSQGVIVL